MDSRGSQGLHRGSSTLIPTEVPGELSLGLLSADHGMMSPRMTLLGILYDGFQKGLQRHKSHQGPVA